MTDGLRLREDEATALYQLCVVAHQAGLTGIMVNRLGEDFRIGLAGAFLALCEYQGKQDYFTDVEPRKHRLEIASQRAELDQQRAEREDT